MGVKRNKLDTVFSELVRERANWTCECCGQNYRHDPGYLHCSHHVSRRHTALRWHPQNASAHCASCHRKFTDRPFDHYDWLCVRFGKEVIDAIRVISHQPVKWNKALKEDIYKHLKAELKRVKEERETEQFKMIEFTPHEAMPLIEDESDERKR